MKMECSLIIALILLCSVMVDITAAKRRNSPRRLNKPKIAARMWSGPVPEMEDYYEQPRQRSFLGRSSCGVPSVLNSYQQQEIVAAHNYWRSREKATNMLKLRWNSELADKAQQHTDQCIHGHSLLDDCAGNRMGQNIFYSQGMKLNLSAAVELWALEREWWYFTAGACVGGKVCGHWTQVVWAETLEVGCGYTETCPDGYTIVTCDYYSAGNYIGQPMYSPGAACSECLSSTKKSTTDRGYTCENNLCVACTPRNDASCTCGPPDTCMNGGTWSSRDCKCACVKGYYGELCQRSCVCRNYDDYCDQYQQYCSEKPYAVFMKEKCPLMCNMCEYPPECY